MNIKQYGTMLAAGALLGLSTTPVYATVCDQPSPLQEMLGEDYWDVELAIETANQPKLSQTTKVQTTDALNVLELLSRNHYSKANGTRYICKGAPDQRRLVEYDSTLRAKSSGDRARRKNDGSHPLDYVRTSDRKIETMQRLDYFEQSDSKLDKISFDQPLIVDLPDASKWQINADHSIQWSQVNRRRNTIGFSMLQQIDTVLAKTTDGIRLSQTLYINGNRESWATWTLVK